MSSNIWLKCLDCGESFPYDPHELPCPACGSYWREAIYDYAQLSKQLTALLIDKPFNIWRYIDLLPLASPHPELSLGEGGTPLLHANNLGMMLGNKNIYIKGFYDSKVNQ